MNEATEAFGLRLRDKAAAEGFNNASLARALDETPQTLANYWNGKRFAPSDLLFRIADAIKVNPRWLVTGEGSSEPPIERSAVHASEEAALLQDFRMMESWQRASLLSMAGTILGRNVIDIEDLRRRGGNGRSAPWAHEPVDADRQQSGEGCEGEEDPDHEGGNPANEA